MDIQVVISAGTFCYDISVTDAGYDAIAEVQRHAVTNALVLAGEDACHAAAAAVPTLADDDD